MTGLSLSVLLSENFRCLRTYCTRCPYFTNMHRTQHSCYIAQKAGTKTMQKALKIMPFSLPRVESTCAGLLYPMCTDSCWQTGPRHLVGQFHVSFLSYKSSNNILVIAPCWCLLGTYHFWTHVCSFQGTYPQLEASV